MGTGCTLIVLADGEEIAKQEVGPETVDEGWLDLRVDLGKYAGREVKLELLNAADGWSFEAGYWSKIELRTE